MVKVCKKKELEYYDDVVSFLTSNEKAKIGERRKRGRAREERTESFYYVFRPRSTTSRISLHANRRPRTSKSSRRTIMKPERRPRREVGPSTAQREWTGGSNVEDSVMERRSNTVSQRSSVEDLNCRHFLSAVDSLELTRERFRSRTRAGSPSRPSPTVPEDTDGGNTPTLTQIFSHFIGGFWTAPVIDEQ